MPNALSSDQFARNVLDRYNLLTEAGGQLTKSARAESLARGSAMPSTGHPDFDHLGLGESDFCNGVAVFIDLVAFTARTFWDDPGQVVRLNTAVMSQVAAIVKGFGGYILGLRGDGVFACFGDKSVRDPKVAAAVAMAACAFALDATKNSLNELLRMSGIRPVQIRAGADYGRLDFVRIGDQDSSEVNVVGFAANFASKCEKFAMSWEVVVGEGLSNLLPVDYFTGHPSSPKSYTRDGSTKFYRYSNITPSSLTSYIRHAQGVQETLDGSPVSSIGYY